MINTVLRWGLKKNYKGFGYITKLIKKENELVFKNCYGIYMSLNPYDKIDSEIIRNGYFEKYVLETLLNFKYNDGDVLWDIGANVGLHSLTLKRLKPRIDIYAFEPYIININKLLNNCSLNPSLQVKSNFFGLSNSVDAKCMYTTDGNLGRTGFEPMTNSNLLSFKIPTLTGDYLVDVLGFPRPSYLKIDTEGHEYSVLKGCEGLLKTSIKGIVFETYSDSERISQYLTQFGFEAIREIGDTSNYVTLKK